MIARASPGRKTCQKPIVVYNTHPFLRNKYFRKQITYHIGKKTAIKYFWLSKTYTTCVNLHNNIGTQLTEYCLYKRTQRTVNLKESVFTIKFISIRPSGFLSGLVTLGWVDNSLSV